MFQRALSLFLLLIVICSMTLYWTQIELQPQDQLLYQKLTQESVELRSHHALETQPAHQIREGVQKDIWIENGKTHYCLKSAHSELTISQKKDKIGAVETLEEIDGSILDGEQTRTFLASRGTYQFPSHQFAAESAQFAFFKDNILSGAAISDQVTYNPTQKTLCLSMNPPRKVLFWQEGMRLSASEVLIKQDAITRKESIQGLGDVHFAFDLEEQNYLDQLFQKYL